MDYYENEEFFKRLEAEFDIPIEKLVEEKIVDESTDPIECAMALQEYLKSVRPDERRISRVHGMTALSRRFYGPYLGRKVAIEATGAIGQPELDERARKRNKTKAINIVNRFRAVGKLATFSHVLYKNETTDMMFRPISLRISEPELLDASGNTYRNVVLPDYLETPVDWVEHYGFWPIEPTEAS